MTNIKATLIFKDGESVVFESVQDLMEYITNNELICRCRTGENLLKIWNHDSEKFEIDSKPIHMIYIYDIQPIDGDKNVVIKCLINLSL